jgi:hypothetical protein
VFSEEVADVYASDIYVTKGYPLCCPFFFLILVDIFNNNHGYYHQRTSYHKPYDKSKASELLKAIENINVELCYKNDP